ncbi:MAG: PDZ domain-containing protein, partial [Gammaproteobacteria bacterium]|nr:PDZ domain-containing protein [Gammaproteobacteria bacterium]
GLPAKDNNGQTTSIGARFEDDPLGAKITHVFTDESAEIAGLSAGDIIIAVNDLKVNNPTINNIVNSYQEGEQLRIHAFRRDELKVFTLTLQAAELTTCYLQLDENMSDEVAKRQKQWLFL